MLRTMRAALIILAAAAPAWGQDASAVEQQVEGLRGQLRAVTEEEAKLQERLRQLEEEMEPQNVERSVAATGTTDAKALRDQRREQLERQRAGVEQRLASLTTSRSRLEAAISTAEAEAVRLRAAALGRANTPPPAAPAAAAPAPAVRTRSAPPRKTKPRKRSRPRRRG